jgi:hypothetical protein
MPICYLQEGLRSEMSSVEGTPYDANSGTKWHFFNEIPAFVQ